MALHQRSTGLWRVLWVLALLGALGLVAKPALPVRADQSIQVTENSYKVDFSKSIVFRLAAQAAAGIKEVTLYYRRSGEIVTVKVPIPVQAGQTTFSYTWELESGDLPPGARIEYEWRVVDAAGAQLKTDAQSFDYSDDRFTWKTMQDAEIVLHWYGSDEAQARRLLGYATQSLARLQDQMGIAPQKPVQIYVYLTSSDMSLALPRHSEAFDDRILTLGVVVDEATLLILGPHSDVQGTMAHELTHVVVGLATHNPYGDLPRWLDEGLAMNAEGAMPAGNSEALKQAVRADTLISVRSLSGYAGDPAEVDLFYGEVYSLVDFMLKTYGKDKMSQLLDAFRGGLYQEQALQRVYGFGIADLDLQWRTSLGLGPRATPVPGATRVVTPQRAPASPTSPCLSLFGGGLLGLMALAYRRRRAGAA